MSAIKKVLALGLLCALLCLSLVGCGSHSPAEDETSQTPPVEEPAPAEPAPEEPAPEETPTSEATLYIGMDNESYQEYPLSYEGELTPEVLIQGIADLTGWDLTLADEVTTGKGGMTVCFAQDSGLFVGPPDPQKEEFHMFDAETYSRTLLDSIKKTLQMNFTGEGGDPDALDIYYCSEGDQPLELSNLERSWPLDQPYEW